MGIRLTALALTGGLATSLGLAYIIGLNWVRGWEPQRLDFNSKGEGPLELLVAAGLVGVTLLALNDL